MTTAVRNFSKAAHGYDGRAHVQRDIAEALAARCDVRPGQRAVDVGSGTGRLAALLRARVPEAFIVGMDAAEGMLARAGGPRVQGDLMRLPFRDQTLDRVLSASAYQWAPSLGGAFAEAARVLKDGGRLHAALFAAGTLREFHESMAAASLPLARRLAAAPGLPTVEDTVAALFGAGFSTVDFETTTRREPFPTVRDAWRWVRDVGANAPGAGMVVGRRALERAERHYAATHDGRVSFVVVYVEAVR